MNVKDIRRENLRALAKKQGGVTKLAESLSKSQSQLSQLIGKTPSKNVGDKLAAEIESFFKKPSGWLDIPHRNLDEETTAKDVILNSAPHRPVPLISWLQYAQTFQHSMPQNFDRIEQLIPSDPSLSDSAFAIRSKDLGQIMRGFPFPSGSIIVFDPEADIYDGAYVLVHSDDRTSFYLRIVKAAGQRFYFKSLHSNHEPLEPFATDRVIALIRQLIVMM